MGRHVGIAGGDGVEALGDELWRLGRVGALAVVENHGGQQEVVDAVWMLGEEIAAFEAGLGAGDDPAVLTEGADGAEAALAAVPALLGRGEVGVGVEPEAQQEGRHLVGGRGGVVAAAIAAEAAQDAGGRRRDVLQVLEAVGQSGGEGRELGDGVSLMESDEGGKQVAIEEAAILDGRVPGEGVWLVQTALLRRRQQHVARGADEVIEDVLG